MLSELVILNKDNKIASGNLVYNILVAKIFIIVTTLISLNKNIVILSPTDLSMYATKFTEH